MDLSFRLLKRAMRAAAFVALLCGALPASAQTLNAYSIWPENWAKPMFEEFEKATGIKVNFVRFSSGEALARVMAEKNNPRVDVLFGGPVETFAAGVSEGVFESYKPPSFAKLPARFRQPDGQWVAIADDPLVFMTSNKFLKDHNLSAPASWNDLLNQIIYLRSQDNYTIAVGLALFRSVMNTRWELLMAASTATVHDPNFSLR